MSSPGNGAIGSLEYTSEERKLLAKKSINWECNKCGKIANLLSKFKCEPITKEESNLINRISLKAEDAAKTELEKNLESNKEEDLFEMTNSKNCTIPCGQNSNESASQTVPEVVAESNDDTLKSFMWLLIAIITLLLARRLFFL